MNVLIACERFNAVRDAFRARGHNAWSCDVESADMQTSAPYGWLYHLSGDVRRILNGTIPPDMTHAALGTRANPNRPGFIKWDLMIAFAPCTFLCSSGLHWNTRRPERAQQTEQALIFVAELLAAPIPMIALENPRGCIGTRIRKADQIIQPYDFGDDASKETHLWLQGLPPLRPTQRIAGRIVTRPDGRTVERWSNQTDSGQNRLPPSSTRAAQRGRTYPGIAAAMADQWGNR